MGAAERKTLLGCLLLVFVQTATPAGDHGRPGDSAGSTTKHPPGAWQTNYPDYWSAPANSTMAPVPVRAKPYSPDDWSTPSSTTMDPVRAKTYSPDDWSTPSSTTMNPVRAKTYSPDHWSAPANPTVDPVPVRTEAHSPDDWSPRTYYPDLAYDGCGDGPRHVRAPRLPVPVACCPEAEDSDFGLVRWPKTGVFEWASVACPCGPSDAAPQHGVARATRHCAFSTTTGPLWRQSDYSKCRTENSMVEDAADAADAAENITSDPSKIDSEAFNEAMRLIFQAQDVAKTNRTVARTMLKALSNMVAAPAAAQEASDGDGGRRRDLFKLMEEHGRSVRLNATESSYVQQFPNLHLAVHKLRLPPNGTVELPVFAASYDEEQAGVSVAINAEVLERAVAAMNASRGTEVRVRFMAMRNGQLLKPPGALSATQQVVTAAVSREAGADGNGTEADLAVRGLSQPVRITMPLTYNSMGTSHVCAYYDENRNDSRLRWRTDGLRVRLDGLTVVCESSHLTPFTLLLDPEPRASMASMAVPLTIVGSIGSALSVVGLALTIVTYKFFSRFSQDRWGRVLVQLCLSLLFLHVAYLVTNLKGVLSPPMCAGVAVVLHAALLASFCWMLVEGLLLYQILITVFRKADSNFILKRHVFAWGGPVVLVALNAAVAPNYYLDTHPDYCLVSGANKLQHILATLLPCVLVMLANCVIFVRVCVVLLRQRQTPGMRQDADDRPFVSCAQIRGVIGVAFLLGVTWPLSPLGANTSLMGVVSSVLNAFQGVAIFVSRVLTHPEARRCWTQRFFTFARSRGDFGSSATYSVNNNHKSSPWLCLRWSSRHKHVASLPKDRRSIVNGANGARPWTPQSSSNNFSSSSGVVLSKTTSETDILY